MVCAGPASGLFEVCLQAGKRMGAWTSRRLRGPASPQTGQECKLMVMVASRQNGHLGNRNRASARQVPRSGQSLAWTRWCFGSPLAPPPLQRMWVVDIPIYPGEWRLCRMKPRFQGPLRGRNSLSRALLWPLGDTLYSSALGRMQNSLGTRYSLLCACGMPSQPIACGLMRQDLLAVPTSARPPRHPPPPRPPPPVTAKRSLISSHHHVPCTSRKGGGGALLRLVNSRSNRRRCADSVDAARLLLRGRRFWRILRVPLVQPTPTRTGFHLLRCTVHSILERLYTARCSTTAMRCRRAAPHASIALELPTKIKCNRRQTCAEYRRSIFATLFWSERVRRYAQRLSIKDAQT